jgi:hypothetical protein
MSPTLSRLGITLAPLSLLLACASGGMANDANVITAPELSQSRATNLYDAIRRVRPEILRTRESSTVIFFGAGRPAVAVDDSLAGRVDVLRAIPVDQVARIEYVSPWGAAERYGKEFGDGLVLVWRRAEVEVSARLNRP